MIKRVLVATGMFWATVSIAIAEQPNVLVVMSDDQGVGDIGFAGNQWARTPVLDRLAAESAQFANIVAAPACTPSRASFLTGRNFNHTGVWGVGPRGYIHRDETYLPEYLRRAGYRTDSGYEPDGLNQELKHRGTENTEKVQAAVTAMRFTS